MTNIGITDGEPLTYDLINLMITRINTLSNQINTLNAGQNVRILGNVSGQNLGAQDNITILCGSQILDITANQSTYQFPIAFGSVFNTAPHVVANIADIRGSGEAAGVAPPNANVSLGLVTKINFVCRVDIIKAVAKNTKVKVNYIAIGASQQT